jgi:transcription termination/antitermination protein NusG
MAREWYVVHTYSGFEGKVAEAIRQRAKIFGQEEAISQVVIPTEEVVEVRKGQKRITPQKFFPGYVLVEMEMTDDSWHLVKSTPKVTGFVGSGARPSPLPREEVDSILHQMEVVEGPFVNFSGMIEDMSPERGKLKVMVQIFGRLTPVELEYYQVERG